MNKNILSFFLKFNFLLFIAMLVSATCFAQRQDIEMADTMRSNGKIYVVVAVCLTILIGLFLYMANVDSRLRKLEKEKV